jgi:hypothetical protein
MGYLRFTPKLHLAAITTSCPISNYMFVAKMICTIYNILHMPAFSGERYVTELKTWNTNAIYKNRKYQCKKLSSLKLVLRTKIMTPVKPQISKFQAEKILPSGL